MNDELKKYILDVMARLIEVRGEFPNSNTRAAINAVCHALATANPEIEAAAREKFDTIRGIQ